MSIFRIASGKVAEEWEGFGTLGMMMQFAMVARPSWSTTEPDRPPTVDGQRSRARR